EGQTLTFEIEENLTAQLKELTENHGTTLYITLLALFNILLSRYAGQEDIIVGSPSAGRQHTDLETIFGMFVNTLAMRNTPQPGKRFIDFLKEVKQNSLDAFENQDYQFDDLLEHLDINRTLDRNPLFDTLFTLQNFDDQELEIKELTFKPCEFENNNSKFDLTLQISEKGATLFAHLEYCVKLFKKETMERLTRHFINILEDVVNQPTTTLAKINMLSEAEEKQLLYEFNDTKTEYPKEKTIHQLFEEQAERTPDHIGIVGSRQLAVGKKKIKDKKEIKEIKTKDKDKTMGKEFLLDNQSTRSTQSTTSTTSTSSTPSTQSTQAPPLQKSPSSIQSALPPTPHHLPPTTSLTYREINKKSNQLATLLREKGVEPDVFVGITAQRSITTIIGIIGILKAGGAYLPIDPDYPEARQQFMLEDSSTTILLTAASPDKAALFHKEHQEIINIEEVVASNAGGAEPVNREPQAGSAYLIYTSGSTGRPKGVVVEHANVVRLVKTGPETQPGDAPAQEKGENSYIQFQPLDRLLQTGSIAFDASTFEIWGPLLNGAGLVLPRKETLLNYDELTLLLKKNNINIMWLTSAMFNLLAASDWYSELFCGLETLLVGGDILSHAHIKRVCTAFPRINVLNGYGPTENTTFSTTFSITAGFWKDAEPGKRIPIGSPIPNSYAYIVDKNNIPTAVGIPGELLVAGDGIARGYLNRPELTAEKFIKNSWQDSLSSPITNNHLYRTGDLARWLPDGNIDFLGRIDLQVKIRGFRIEPGEVENQLLSHEKIKEAIVTFKRDKDDNNYLTAYYTQNHRDSGSNSPQPLISIALLRDFLSEKLPDYMIPAYFISLEKLPLTPNGKIDKKALPEPGETARIFSEFKAPTNETEKKLATIWQEVLGMKQIGITDNFFEIGGHSLKAINMISQIKKTFQVDLPLAVLFEKPFIADQARYISNAVTSHFTAITAVEKKDFYPVTAAQKRMAALNSLAPESVNYNIPDALLIKGEPSKIYFKEAFQKLITRHESLRTSFHLIDGNTVQRVHSPERTDFRITFSERRTKSSAPEQETGEALSNFLRPFTLSRAPLMRVELVKLEEQKHIFLFDMHHIICDGESMGILVKEFSALYAGRELSPLTLQYKDYAAWQNRFMKSGNLLKQKKYWLEKFSGEIPVLAILTDYPRPPVQSFEGETLVFKIDEPLTVKLKELTENHGTTLYITLLAL
ncbi:MAG: amino acid adenylation domain-containing protein, partial [bacterium]|nr:amino acid adenylation domain-containing protein [bacterium]